MSRLSISSPANNVPLGQRSIMVGIVTVGALLVHGGQNVLPVILPVRPSFRLSDGHEGQEVVSNF